jgi:hypothetical protein
MSPSRPAGSSSRPHSVSAKVPCWTGITRLSACGRRQCAASWSAIVSSGIFPTWSSRLSRMAISVSFLK